MSIITEDSFYKTGEELFGPDKTKWRFKCPICSHIQSMDSVKNHLIKEYGNEKFEAVKENIHVYFNCEGRINPSHGCNYSLGGLFKVGDLFEIKRNVKDKEFKLLSFKFSIEKETSGKREGM